MKTMRPLSNGSRSRVPHWSDEELLQNIITAVQEPAFEILNAAMEKHYP